MMLRPEFVIRLERRDECGVPFRYPACTPPDPAAPTSVYHDIRAGIAHFQVVAAWFQMRAGLVPKTLATIADARRQQIFPECLAGNGGDRLPIHDHIHLHRLAALRIVRRPSRDACIRECIYATN